MNAERLRRAHLAAQQGLWSIAHKHVTAALSERAQPSSAAHWLMLQDAAEAAVDGDFSARRQLLMLLERSSRPQAPSCPG
jgi:hypothetical protein